MIPDKADFRAGLTSDKERDRMRKVISPRRCNDPASACSRHLLFRRYGAKPDVTEGRRDRAHGHSWRCGLSAVITAPSRQNMDEDRGAHHWPTCYTRTFFPIAAELTLLLSPRETLTKADPTLSPLKCCNEHKGHKIRAHLRPDWFSERGNRDGPFTECWTVSIPCTVQGAHC